MKESAGQKIFFGIIVAIVLGVGAYFVGLRADGLPSISSQVASPVATQYVSRIPDVGMSREASDVMRSLEGSWQNDEDYRFRLEFASNGIVVDRYVGDTLITKVGTWGVFTADMAEDASSDLVPGLVYLLMTIDGNARYFRVSLAEGALDLVYLEGGSRLHFTKF